MDTQVWLAYFVASWAIALSPGSGAVLSMSHGLAYGVRGASATIGAAALAEGAPSGAVPSASVPPAGRPGHARPSASPSWSMV